MYKHNRIGEYGFNYNNLSYYFFLTQQKIVLLQKYETSAI